MNKICLKHPDASFIKKGKTAKGTQRYRCKSCMKELHHENYLKNREKIIERARLYKLTHPEWRKKKNNEYYHANKDRLKEKKNESDKKYQRKIIDELRDQYVADVFIKRSVLRRKDVPLSIIEVKRIDLTLKRLTKEKQK